MMLNLAEEYARLKGVILLSHSLKEDGSITFVISSGQKLSKTENELKHDIALLKQSLKTENPTLAIKNIEKVEAKTKKEK